MDDLLKNYIEEVKDFSEKRLELQIDNNDYDMHVENNDIIINIPDCCYKFDSGFITEGDINILLSVDNSIRQLVLNNMYIDLQDKYVLIEPSIDTQFKKSYDITVKDIPSEIKVLNNIKLNIEDEDDVSILAHYINTYPKIQLGIENDNILKVYLLTDLISERILLDILTYEDKDELISNLSYINKLYESNKKKISFLLGRDNFVYLNGQIYNQLNTTINEEGLLTLNFENIFNNDKIVNRYDIRFLANSNLSVILNDDSNNMILYDNKLYNNNKQILYTDNSNLLLPENYGKYYKIIHAIESILTSEFLEDEIYNLIKILNKTLTYLNENHNELFHLLVNNNTILTLDSKLIYIPSINHIISLINSKIDKNITLEELINIMKEEVLDNEEC